MCLIVLAWQAHPDYPLVVAANRDEFYARPAQPSHFWPDHPELLAGRDSEAGGTWLGITRQGRFAAVTNVRDPEAPAGTASRGWLTRDYLLTDTPPRAHAETLLARRPDTGRFNLLLGDTRALWWLHDRAAAPRALPPGVHGISNALLDTPWPKVQRSREALQRLLSQPAPSLDGLLTLLRDDRTAPDDALPDTGIGREQERRLSPPFVHLPGYGTRASTALRVHRSGRVQWREQTFHDGRPAGAPVDWDFHLAID